MVNLKLQYYPNNIYFNATHPNGDLVFCSVLDADGTANESFIQNLELITKQLKYHNELIKAKNNETKTKSL